MKLPKPQRNLSHPTERPYINDHYSVIEEKAIKNWENPIILQELLFELNRRKTEWAIDLRNKIKEKLEELESECFRFPRTDTEIGSGELEIKDRKTKGLLQAAGYARGQKAFKIGLDKVSRRAILDSVYTKTIPKNLKIDDIEKWGKRNTGQRLKMMVYSLAHFVNQERRNYRGDYRISISDGRSDLKYLKAEYYDGEYDWIYPKTN